MEKLNKILIIKIGIILVFLIVIISGGIILYKNSTILASNKFTSNKFFDTTSDVIYKLIWKDKYEKKILEEELKLSDIKRNQAENKANEEAIARASVEEKSQQEEVLKNQAEARAKQEEYEKKLREQELSEKEAEEKKMNADNDNDGLTGLHPFFRTLIIQAFPTFPDAS